MRLFSRQDVLLLAGLAVALAIVFAAPIARVLDYARDLERQSGLSLIPGLALLIAVFAFHQLRLRSQEQARAAAAEAASREAERQADELERLVAFGQALGLSLDLDSMRVAIAQHLPALVGTNQVWVLVRKGVEWEALAGDTRGAEDVLQWGDLAEQLLTTGQKEDRPARMVGFPLIVGGSAVGVLGVRPDAGLLAPGRRPIIEAAAALLAVSVRNVALARDVREHSVRDPLTGCFTRGHSMEAIDAELRRARRSQTPVSLIMFDLDHFKDVNDRYGHLCGDTVLGAVGKRMRDVLRGSDLKCRYGGEVFLVLLPETPLHGARRVAETIRREIAERPVPWSGDVVSITASFGIAQTLPGEVNVQAMIARAEQALYRAKDDGRNCVRIGAETATLAGDETSRKA